MNMSDGPVGGSDSEWEVAAWPATATAGEETSGNASGPAAPVQIADSATAQTTGQEASANASGSIARVQPEADAAPPRLTRAERWKANRSAWIAEVANTMLWLAGHQGPYERSHRTDDPRRDWNALRLPDPEALAQRRHKELMNRFDRNNAKPIACCVCGAFPR